MRALPFPFRAALAGLLVATTGITVSLPVRAAPQLAGRAAHLTTRAGRRSSRAPRRAGLGRRERAIPWMKGSLPNVQAQGAFVLDLVSGQELFARRPDEPRPIASISKLAATLTVVDRGLDLDALTTITRGDADVARGGARSRLHEGMTLPNRDLLHAALLGSDNRAIPALGRAVGLSAPQLAAAMTAKVRELGLKNTRFIEPTGLSPENVSTPREILELLRAVMDHPVLGQVTRRTEYDAQPVGRAPIHYNNTHRPAARPNTLVLGGKTGFNNAARYCLVLAARVSGRTLGMAFLGNEGEMTRFGDVARVADWIAMQEPREAAPRALVAAANRSPATTTRTTTTTALAPELDALAAPALTATTSADAVLAPAALTASPPMSPVLPPSALAMVGSTTTRPLPVAPPAPVAPPPLALPPLLPPTPLGPLPAARPTAAPMTATVPPAPARPMPPTPPTPPARPAAVSGPR